MPKELKLASIEAKDEGSLDEIIAAFAAMYSNPPELDGEGNPTGQPKFTPEGLVKHHTNNFIRGVVSEYRQRLKRQEIDDAGVVAKEYLK
jgi:hypothetical protein